MNLQHSLALIVSMASLGSAHAVVVYQNDFNANSTAGLSLSGQNVATWAAADGKLQSSLSTTAHNPAGPGFAAIVGVSSSAHFKIEGDVQVVGNVPGRGTDFGHVGFFWGYQDASHYSIGYLRTHSNHVTAWQVPYSSELILPLPFNTVNALTAADPAGPSYHLAYEVNYLTQQLTVTLDGQSMVFGPSAFGNASNPAGIGGALGMISWGEHVSYDNVKVTDFTAAVPEPSEWLLMVLGLGALAAVGARRR